MAADTARIIEQLLKRFEALRLCEPIEVLAVDKACGGLLSEELPVTYERFSRATKIVSCNFGKPEAGEYPVQQFYLLGPAPYVSKLARLCGDAGELLSGRLKQWKLIQPSKFHSGGEEVLQCTWLISLLNAAERRAAPTLKLKGADWFAWNRPGNVTVGMRTVERYRQATPAEGAKNFFDSWAEQVVAGVDDRIVYATIEDAVEASISLLQLLQNPLANKAEKVGAEPAEDTDKPVRAEATTEDILKAMWSDKAGKEILLGMTVRQIASKIGRSPSSVVSNEFWKTVIQPQREKLKAKKQLNNYAIENAPAPPEDPDLGEDVQ